MKISGFQIFLQFGANTKIKLPQAMSARQNLPRVEIRQQSHRFFCPTLPSHPTCMVRLSWHRVNCKPGLISGGGGGSTSRRIEEGRTVWLLTCMQFDDIGARHGKITLRVWSKVHVMVVLCVPDPPPSYPPP